MMKIAAIRVRGSIGIRKPIRDTLDMLRLYEKNQLVLLENTPQNLGMLNKVKDFITFGTIDESLTKELFTKRGEEYTGRTQDSKEKISYKRRFVEIDGKKYKKFFRLNPPKGGYGRKGIKKSFSQGGALGNRKEKIAELVKKDDLK